MGKMDWGEKKKKFSLKKMELTAREGTIDANL